MYILPTIATIQPGDCPSRGLLRDCENWWIICSSSRVTSDCWIMFWRQTNNKIKCSNLKLHEEHKLKRNILGRAKIPQQSLQQRPMQYLPTLLLERQMTPGKGRHKQRSGLREIWKRVKNAISVANEALPGRSLFYTGVSAVPKSIKGKIIVPHYPRLRTKKPFFPKNVKDKKSL